MPDWLARDGVRCIIVCPFCADLSVFPPRRLPAGRTRLRNRVRYSGIDCAIEYVTPGRCGGTRPARGDCAVGELVTFCYFVMNSRKSRISRLNRVVAEATGGKEPAGPA